MKRMTLMKRVTVTEWLIRAVGVTGMAVFIEDLVLNWHRFSVAYCGGCFPIAELTIFL
jgi:hypothetical protein